MVERVTITLDDIIFQRVQEIRSSLIPVLIKKGILRDMNLTTTINYLLLASIIGVDDFKQERFDTLVNFLMDRGNELNKEDAEGLAQEIKKTWTLSLPPFVKYTHEKKTK